MCLIKLIVVLLKERYGYIIVNHSVNEQSSASNSLAPHYIHHIEKHLCLLHVDLLMIVSLAEMTRQNEIWAGI